MWPAVGVLYQSVAWISPFPPKPERIGDNCSRHQYLWRVVHNCWSQRNDGKIDRIAQQETFGVSTHVLSGMRCLLIALFWSAREEEEAPLEEVVQKVSKEKKKRSRTEDTDDAPEKVSKKTKKSKKSKGDDEEGVENDLFSATQVSSHSLFCCCAIVWPQTKALMSTPRRRRVKRSQRSRVV